MTSRVSIPLLICIGGAAIALIALFVPIGGGGDAAPPATTAAVADAAPADASQLAAASDAAAISIANFSFDSDVVVQAGQVIEVSNLDGSPHTLTSTDGLFGSGVLSGGDTATFVAPAEPGTYSFFCEPHPSMTGAFQVGS